MLVYIANWASKENEPEVIVKCEPWVEQDEGKNLILKLTRRKHEGKPEQIMAIRLDSAQVEQIVRMVLEEDMINLPITEGNQP